MKNIVKYIAACFAKWIKGWRDCIDECKRKKVICLDKYRHPNPSYKELTMNNKAPHQIASGEMFSEKKIYCPVCGIARTFPWAVRCNPAGNQGGEVIITAQGMRHDQHVTPEGCGVAIEIDFACMRGHVFAAKFHFQKGITTLRQSFLYDDASESFSNAFGNQVIWRD